MLVLVSSQLSWVLLEASHCVCIVLYLNRRGIVQALPSHHVVVVVEYIIVRVSEQLGQ